MDATIPRPTVSDRARAAGVVFASTLANALSVTPTVSAVFGVFLVPIAMEFHWSRAQVSGAAAIVSLATAVAYPFAGWVGDKAGARRTALIGTLAFGVAILSLAFARPDPILFYVQFAVIGAAGALPSSMIYAKLLSEWFEARRGLWMGVSSGASGLGVTVLPVLAGATVVALGWRGSYVCIALLVLLLSLPVQYFLLADAPAARLRREARLDDHPQEVGGLTSKEAYRTVTFWLLLTSLPVGGGVLIALAINVVPLLMDGGISLAMATAVAGTIGLTSSVGEAGAGFLLDSSKSARRLCPFYLFAIAGVLLLLVGGQPILAGALIGIGMAAEFSAISFLVSRYFGRKSLGAISGVAFSFMLVVGSIATVAFNAIFDRTGSYRLALLAILPFLVWNTVAPALMGRYRFAASSEAMAEGD